MSSERGLVTRIKLRVGAWSLEWGLGFQRGDLVRMKNQMLSRYLMHELS